MQAANAPGNWGNLMTGANLSLAFTDDRHGYGDFIPLPVWMADTLVTDEDAQKSGFTVGLNHVVAVLTGSESEKVRHWGHDQLTTYGIGQEHSRNEWGAIARELMRLGYLAQSTGQFPTVDVTAEGMAVLGGRYDYSVLRRFRAWHATQKA